MIKSQKTINVLIDNIDPFRGIRGNITNDNDTFSTIEDMFPESTINYYASGTLMCKNKLIDNWIYPVIIHNLTFINFMFDWAETDRDIIALLPTVVQRQYFEGRGTIVIIVKEPLQTMNPDNDDLQNFIRMIERNPRYSNILFLTLHYIDSPNFMFTNIIENMMTNWGPLDDIYKNKTKEKFDLLEEYTNRRFLCLNINYKESPERLLLLKFLEKYDLLDEGFVSALDYPNDKLIHNIDIVKGFDKALLNIIPEGNFDRKGYQFITEKTYRSFLYKKPFIYLGQYQGLKYIKTLGYKTFSSIIDESYDDIENDKRRVAAVCKEIKRLMSKPFTEFKKDMKQLEDICNYNYDRYFYNKEKYKDKFYKKIYGTNNEPYNNKKL